ncbi:MAG TPA: hypothetical protein VFR90_05250 [Methylibium sp.]|uniref:hypothetical protein n=1 Tax=Methylibium sp. TaxID=2067992 RepID=UPI002DC03D08|nr:hypothetical protein [Methylibium sp.]HEU4458509.1 hypothetical protein [Methylibium sp.]
MDSQGFFLTVAASVLLAGCQALMAHGPMPAEPGAERALWAAACTDDPRELNPARELGLGTPEGRGGCSPAQFARRP